MTNDAKTSFEEKKLKNELLDYFEKGKAFTQELMLENERLRLRVLGLERQYDDLQSRQSSERVRVLEEENAKLRGRLEELESRFGEVEKENQDFAKRYVEVQSQNDNLLNLYVSSYQLHATLDPEEVVTVIHEIMLNLIGAERFKVLMIDDRKMRLTMVAGEDENGPIRGHGKAELDPEVETVLREGGAIFRDEENPDRRYLACVPLRVKREVVGAITISKLMDQKKHGLTTIDHELLDLMADHAAAALVSSDVFSRTERKLRTVENFLELLQMDSGRDGAGGRL